MALVPARRAAELYNFFGANVKLGWDIYPSLQTHVDMIKYLDIRNIRAGFVSGTKENFIDLHTFTGAKLCMLSALEYGSQTGLNVNPAEIVQTIKEVGKDKIAYVEQANEQDLNDFEYGGQVYPESVNIYAEDLHNALKADPYTADIPIIGASVAYYDDNGIDLRIT